MTDRNTLELLDRALAQADSAQQLAQTLGLSRSALAVARHRGKVSPLIAGLLAERLGDEPGPWIAQAALEAEPASRARDRLLARLTAKSYFSHDLYSADWTVRRGAPTVVATSAQGIPEARNARAFS